MAETSKDKEKDKDKEKERGAKDDWEALKIVLDSLPSLKQRVLHKLREMKNRHKDGGIKVTRQAQQDYMREARKKKQK